MKKSQVILITGASSGFGRISAQMLAERGHTVYGTSRKPSPSAPSGKIKMLVMDITRPESIGEGLEQIYREQGEIDVLINNAGIGISGALELATDEEIALQMNTNFMGVSNMCKAVLPKMRKRQEGKIINIGSIAGVVAVPYQGFYSASKFAVEGYSEALALELHPAGVKVCIVEPGDFNTGFTSNRLISQATLEDAHYGSTFKNSMKLIEEAEQKGCNPKKLGASICRIVERKNPPFRTLVGPASQVFFARCKKWLPDKWGQFMLRKFYQI